MGASPWLLGRPPWASAVHGPCREHCRALVQAFSVLWARSKQHRAVLFGAKPSSERKLQGTASLSTLSSTASTCSLTEHLSFSVIVQQDLLLWKMKQCKKSQCHIFALSKKSLVFSGSRHQTRSCQDAHYNCVFFVHNLSRKSIQPQPAYYFFQTKLIHKLLHLNLHQEKEKLWYSSYQ